MEIAGRALEEAGPIAAWAGALLALYFAVRDNPRRRAPRHLEKRAGQPDRHQRVRGRSFGRR